MKFKHLFLMACMIATTAVYAQDVDKATVTGNADAAKAAGDDLKKVDTGEKAWKFDGSLGLNAAATGFVNWAAGGNNNVNGVAFAKLHLLYHKDAIAWETNFDTDFGMSYIDQDEDPLQKTNDNIKLATKFGWEFYKDFYLTALGSFQSQYAIGRNYVAGYNPAISKWLAPSYTDISVGIDYKHSYNGADFSVYLSPIAGRIATAYVGDAWNEKYTKEAALGDLKYVMDQAEKGSLEYDAAKLAYDAAEALYSKEAYELLGNKDFRTNLQEKYGTYKYNDDGTPLYRNYRAELGLSFKGAIAYKYENLTLGTTLALFSPYQGKGFELPTYVEGSNDPLTFFQYSNNNRYFGHFDVDWDVAISYQFLKVLNVTLSTSLKYYNGVLIADKEGNLAERVQFKSVFGLGIGYSF